MFFLFYGFNFEKLKAVVVIILWIVFLYGTDYKLALARITNPRQR